MSELSIYRVIESDELLEVGRRAIEKTLIEWRDSRLSTMDRNNGLVVREKSGEYSNIIRFGPEMALRIGLKAIAEHTEKQETK